MKLKFIKDDEVIVPELEYINLESAANIFMRLESSVRTQTASYGVVDYGDMCEVVVTDGKGYMTIKQFNSDDPDYNRICAEELYELLNQKQ